LEQAQGEQFDFPLGIDMSGRRPLIKGYFAALRLIVGAVMSSACLMRVMTPVGADVVR
jgi:hypothetical protein